MSLTMQVKLLRVLEDRKIERLGSVKQIALDIRIIAATNRDLKKLVAERRFREDLYYRLNVITIDLPPLRDRGGDLLLLAERFVEKCARKVGKEVSGIDSEAARILNSYHWPGNVRELENIIERAVVLTRTSAISRHDLVGLDPREATPSSSREITTIAEVEKDHIKHCLDELDWNIGICAEKLGIHRNTLRSKIKEYQLSRDTQ